VSKADNPINP